MNNPNPLSLPDDPELALLLASCRAQPSSTELASVLSLAAAVRDWARLVQLAHRHQVSSLLVETLRAAGVEGQPEAVSLENSRRWNLHQVLAMVAELRCLLDAFQAAGVVAVPFKGLALAEALYGRKERRGAGDLDLMVHARDVPAVETVLFSRGYRLYREQREGDLHDRAFARDADRAFVEIHWSLKADIAGSCRTLEDLLPHLVPGRLVGKDCLCFPPELLLVLLAEHGARHGWERLKWLCDVAELLRGEPDLDWKRVEQHCGGPNSRRAVQLALLLAHGALAAPLPSDRAPSQFAGEVLRVGREMSRSWGLAEAPPLDAREQWRYSLVLADGMGARLRVIQLHLAALARPTAADRQWLDLPGWLGWSYPGLRLLRVGSRKARDWLSRKDQTTGI